MSDYQFNSLEDFVNFFYNSCNNQNSNCNNCEFGNKNAEADFSSRCANSDIPGGFQDANPQFLIIATTILGTILAEKMPFNIQNSVGNWLELLGQTIIYFNAQQQYFQGGPGRIYNPIYRNAANPFCENSSDESQRSESSKPTTSNSSVNSFNEEYSIQDLKLTIDELHKELNNLKNELNKLKNYT